MTKTDFDQLEASAQALYARAERPTWFDLAPTPELVRQSGEATTGLALDLGAGSGRNTSCLLKAGWRVVAVELDARAVELGRQSAPTASWQLGSVLRLDEWVTPASVDLAVDVLGPAGDLKAVWLPEYVRQVFRAMQAKGQWVLQTFLTDAELESWQACFTRISAAESDVGRWLVYEPRTESSAHA